MKKLISILLLNILCLTLSYAQPANETLNQLLRNIHSMQADFTQTMLDNKGKIIQKSHGKLALQRPGEFRWETVAPNRQLVLANGKRLWIYDPDLEQVIVRGLAKQAGETPALLLSDANPALETDFIVSQDTKSDLQWFNLKPKDPNSLFASLRMGFSGNELHEMQLQDRLDHKTIIRFQNISLNNPVSAALFQFKPPKNVDVIDETKK